MKNKLLFLDMEFTSLSPDAQLISLGIISDCNKSIYCEFNDYDINRCDDWVKENVVRKLEYNKILETQEDFRKAFEKSGKDKRIVIQNIGGGDFNLYTNEDIPKELDVMSDNDVVVTGAFEGIKNALKMWLKQFSDYQIQFVCDCGTFDWYWMLQLIGTWKYKNNRYMVDICDIPPGLTLDEFTKQWEDKNRPLIVIDKKGSETKIKVSETIRTGLPILPSNVSPVPFELNNLIADKKGISVRESFDLDRNWLANDYTTKEDVYTVFAPDMLKSEKGKHNALYDAQVIKAIYNKLK